MVESLDLPTLIYRYSDSRAQWRAVGCRLGISQGDLNAIEVNKRGKCEDCFTEVLSFWLQMGENRQEDELARAVEEVASSPGRDEAAIKDRTALLVLLCTCTTALLLALLLSVSPSGIALLYRETPVAAATRLLKEDYRHHQVVEFELLNYNDDMPILNVSLKNETGFFESGQLFRDIEVQYQQLIENAKVQDDKNKRGSRVLVTGHPGAGKTTMLRQLAKEWAEGKALGYCQILFLIHLDRLSKDRKPQSLSDLLELTSYNDLKNIKQLIEDIREKNGAGTCFLLDSYDGWAWREYKDYVYRLFYGDTLHLSLCVLSSRPLGLKVVKNIQSIETVGFGASDLEGYLGNLSNDNDTIKTILKLWEDSEHIKEMCKLPLHMVMLIYIAKNNGNLLLETRTQVYIAFMNVTIKHFAEHHPNWNTVSLKQCILSNDPSDDLCVAFHNLTYVAYEMLFNKVDTFPEYPSVVKNINKLGFVKVTKVKSTGDQVRYTFYHPTFIDYYAAIQLLRVSYEKRFYLYVKDLHENRRFCVNLPVWVYFFGLLGEHYGDNISIPTILRYTNMYCLPNNEGLRQPGCCCTVVLAFIREIGWRARHLDILLESSGLLVNRSLCVDGPTGIGENRGIQHIFKHATFDTLKNGRSTCIKDIKTTNVHFLSLYLQGLDSCRDPEEALLLEEVRKAPQTVQVFSIELRSGQIQPVVSALNKLPRNLKFQLKIIDRDLHGTLQSLDTLQYPNRLEKLTASFKQIFTFRKFTGLKHLSVSFHNSYSDNGAFLEELPALNQLEMLDIQELKIGRALTDKLAAFLPLTLTELRLNYNNIDDQTITVLEESLRNMHELTSLSLSFNRITGKGLRTLVDALKSHHNFTKLDLSGNPLVGMNDIDSLKVLTELKNLRDLKLGNCSIGKRGIQTLVAALESNVNLHSLDLSHNPFIRSRGGLEQLARLGSVHHLDISGWSHHDAFSDSRRAYSSHVNSCARVCNVDHFNNQPYYYNYTKTDAEQSKIHGERLSRVLKHLTQLQSLTLCTAIRTEAPIYWSEELASAIVGLPKLQLLNAPCIVTDKELETCS